MDRKKNVSIRLNGKEQSYYERKNKNEIKNKTNKKVPSSDEIAAAVEANNIEDTLSFHEMKKNDDEQASKNILDLEKMRQEKEDRSGPFWDDGVRDKGPKLPPFHRKKKRPSKFSFKVFSHSLFLSIVSAILVGAAFGLFLLHIFTTGDTVSIVNGNNSSNQVGGVVNEEEDSDEYVIPSLNLHVIQGGAFSTTEKGDEIVSSFHSNGYPALLTEKNESNELMYLFIGISSHRDNAEKIASYYEEEDYGTYVKAYDVFGYGETIPEEWFTFLDNGVKWMEEAAYLSSNDVLEVQSTEGDRESIVATAIDWRSSLEQMETSENDELYAMGQTWIEQGLEVLNHFESYSTEEAWSIQDRLLNMMMMYEGIVEFLLANS
ncbi:hypothetical protein QA612_05075 [Evansella sp. AB-P1]|uniref:hypothetical protein n=1 Tax=Evansella sp. AB-P1 TaxID=3037653 RepID=UPI00241C70A1|nr:hypothetical protein [Evansella sp. AB-P1]MDG5786856.1 hypothetical protein [Evansella sp. AB-P1]